MKNLSKDTQIRAFMALFLLIIIISLFQNCKKTPTAPDIPQFGSIRVESLPTGAKVYLDGLDTGRTTNCILSDISTGSHYVKLVLEGYRDVEQTVTVSAGGTFPVNINFVGHSIMITKPAEESIVIIGDEYEIKWETDNSINLNEYRVNSNTPAQLYERNHALENVELLTLTNVRIELFKGGSQERTIVSNTENDGTYMWRIPSNLTMASNYRIKITCATAPDVYCMSDKFSIEFQHKEYSWGPTWGSWMSIYSNKWTTVKVNINDVGIIKKVDFYVFTTSYAHSGMKGTLEHNNRICNFSGGLIGYGGGTETTIFNGLQMNGEWIFNIRGDPPELGGTYWGSLDGIDMTIYYSNSY